MQQIQADDNDDTLVGLFSCRDTLPWELAMRRAYRYSVYNNFMPSGLDLMDFLPLINNAPGNGNLYLPQDQAKYRYHYFLRCQTGFILKEVSGTHHHYGGLTRTVDVPWNDEALTARPRSKISCQPDRARLNLIIQELATLRRGDKECLDMPTPPSPLRSIVLVLSITDEHGHTALGSSSTVTRRSDGVGAWHDGPTTFFSHVIDKTEKANVYRVCEQFIWLPGHKQTTRGQLNLYSLGPEER